MKQLKTLVALVLALALTMSVVGGALASTVDPTTRTHVITITNGNQTGTHTYSAYKVFSGVYDSTSGKLSNIAWADGVNSSALITALQAASDLTIADPDNAGSTINPFAGKTNPEDIADAMGKFSSNTAAANKIADLIAANLTANVHATSTGLASPYSITVTGDGYYFIKDTGTIPENDSATRYILQVEGPVNITAKSSTVTPDKKVKDKNDNTGVESGWQIDADYDIGDEIPFQISITLPSDYVADFDTYYLKFIDTISAGLTYKADSAKIFIGDADTTGTPLEPTSADYAGTDDDDPYKGGKVLSWEITDVKTAYTTATNSTKIRIEYTATLNTNAVVGSAGNPNKLNVEYTNNPSTNEHGTTPDKTNLVFTFKGIVNKVDDNRQALNGADFTLYKVVPSTATGATKGDALKTSIASTSPTSDTAALDNDSYYIAVGNVNIGGEKTGSSAGSQFTFNGIDSGNYVLVETTVPAGYNSYASVAVTVTATTTNGALTDLEISGPFENETAANGTGTAEIMNTSGTVLPSTGGIGTTIFYVVGIVLVLGAAAVIIARRKAEQE